MTAHDPYRGAPFRGGAYPVNGNVADVTRWAGDDPERIAQALDAENQRKTPRKTVLALAAKLS